MPRPSLTSVRVAVAALLLASSALAAAPAEPGQAAPPPKTTDIGTELRSSWKDVDPAALGAVRPLLVDRPDLRVTPTRHIEFDRSVVGTPGDIVTLSRSPHLAILSTGPSGFEIRTVHRDTGVVSPVITLLTLPNKAPVAFEEAPDGKTVIVRDTPDAPILLIDAATGTIRTALRTAEVGTGDVRVVDETTLAVINRVSGRVTRLSAADGKVLGSIQLPPCIPIATGRGRIVGQLRCDPPNAPGETKERRMLYVAFDATTGQEVGRREMLAGPAATGVQSPLFAVGEVDTGWSAMRIYDGLTLAERSRVPLVPSVHSYGLEVTPDGRHVAMLEYRAQPVIFWATASGAAEAVIGPERGGYIRFDISDDGKILGGIVGPWVNGNLIPDAFEWTELDRVPQLAPRPARP